MTDNLPVGDTIVQFHDRLLACPGWPASTAGAIELPGPVMLWNWIAANHRNNGLLWAEEDLARRTQVGDAEIALNKRRIDGYNQARNDATERVDELLLIALGLVDEASARGDVPVSRAAAGARLNSETAGSMIDRMSILALKIDAMHRQTLRGDVDEAHRVASRQRLGRLREQRDDLAGCFDQLLADCQAGRACFKVYRQFKMYNDPRFNPALVAELGRSGAAAG